MNAVISFFADDDERLAGTCTVTVRHYKTGQERSIPVPVSFNDMLHFTGMACELYTTYQVLPHLPERFRKVLEKGQPLTRNGFSRQETAGALHRQGLEYNQLTALESQCALLHSIRTMTADDRAEYRRANHPGYTALDKLDDLVEQSMETIQARVQARMHDRWNRRPVWPRESAS